MKLVSLDAVGTSVHFQLDEGAKSSLLSRFRFNLNWEKAILYSNIAIIISGIAYGFFMRLPMMMLGLATGGLVYLGLHSKAIAQRPTGESLYQVQAQIQVEEEEHSKLSKKLEAHLDRADDPQKKVIYAQRQLENLQKEKQSVEKDVNKFLSESKTLESKLQTLKSTRRMR